MPVFKAGPLQPGHPPFGRGVILHTNGRPDGAAEGDIVMVAVPLLAHIAAQLLQRGGNLLLVAGPGTLKVQGLPFGLAELDGFRPVQQPLIDVSMPGWPTLRTTMLSNE